MNVFEYFRRKAILDSYPISPEGQIVYVPGVHGFRTVAANHIPVTVYLNIQGQLTGAISAYLDPGHNQNFSISEDQLRWLEINPNSLRTLGSVKFRNERIPLKAADIVLCGNKTGSRELNPKRNFMFPFSNDQGILVHKEPIAALPILGIRGILRNKLKLSFDGGRMSVTLTT